MLKLLATSLVLFLTPTLSQAEMFTSTSEASSHDARCTKNERDAGTCGRDADIRYKRDIQHRDMRVEQNIDIERRGYDPRYDQRYDPRYDRRYDPRYDDRRHDPRYDPRRDDKHDRRDDRRDYDHGDHRDDRRGHRPDPNWKEKHDIRTEDGFERQRRKDQEYYDKY